MKIKYIAIYVALAAAFLAVSLWVVLSGGRDAKAIRTKYRLGGLMLTVSAMLSLTSCESVFGLGTSCYDPVMPEYVKYPSTNRFKVGDEIEISIQNCPYENFTYKMLGNSGHDLLQEGELGKDNGIYRIKLEPTEYKGEAMLEIFGTNSKGLDVGIGAILFTIE